MCEAFGYIPRTGESTKVVLRKADAEEGSDRRDGEGDHQEDRRDKFQKYRLEVWSPIMELFNCLQPNLYTLS